MEARRGRPVTKIILSENDKNRLEQLAEDGTFQERDRVRAKIILLKSRNKTQEQIQTELSVSRRTVMKWVRRYLEQGIEGLKDSFGGEEKTGLSAERMNEERASEKKYISGKTEIRNSKPFRGSDIRRRNEKIILELIHQNSCLSQSDAVQVTGLKSSTVLRIFSQLMEKNLIRYSGRQLTDNDKKGRKPVYYELNPTAKFAIGVDFWAENATIVIVNYISEPVHTEIIHFKKEITAEQVCGIIISMIASLLNKLNIANDKVLGIGIGAPGKINIRTGEVIDFSSIQGMNGYNLKEIMRDHFQLPVFIHNNTSVIALNEFKSLKGEEINSLLMILIRSGVGGAFLHDGNLLVNNNRTILEIGNMAVPGENPDACLEDLVSENVILNEISDFKGDKTISDIDGLIESRDRDVSRLIHEKAEILYKAIKNVSFLLNPSMVLINTRSQRLSENLCSMLSELQRSDKNKFTVNLHYIPQCYDPKSAGKGAAQLVFNEYYRL